MNGFQSLVFTSGTQLVKWNNAIDSRRNFKPQKSYVCQRKLVLSQSYIAPADNKIFQLPDEASVYFTNISLLCATAYQVISLRCSKRKLSLMP